MAITRIDTNTTQITNTPSKAAPDYIVRVAIIVLAMVMSAFVASTALSGGCMAGLATFWTCDLSPAIILLVAAIVGAAFGWTLIMRPVATHSSVENKTAQLEFNQRRMQVTKAQALDEIDIHDRDERLRIDRDYAAGMNGAEVYERKIIAESKGEVIKALAAGVVAGTVEPHHFAQVARILGGTVRPGSVTPLALAPANFIDADLLQPEPVAPITDVNRYKLTSIGGNDSPVKGKDIRATWLTCTLRSLRAAVAIAESGGPPSRTAFNTYGIKANIEVADCHAFFQECGIMQPGTGWGAWVEGLDSRKFARWVAYTIDVVERGGGEDVFRRAARQAADRERPTVEAAPTR